MAWLLALGSLIFGWMSLSMYLAAFKETEPALRNQLMRKGFGTLVLALMGLSFAYYSFHPPTEPAETPVQGP